MPSWFSVDLKTGVGAIAISICSQIQNAKKVVVVIIISTYVDDFQMLQITLDETDSFSAWVSSKDGDLGNPPSQETKGWIFCRNFVSGLKMLKEEDQLA